MTITSTRSLRPTAARFALQIASAGICMALLSGCATTKKVAAIDGTAEAETAADAVGLLAGNLTPSATGYVDPMVTTANSRKPMPNGMMASPARALPNGKLAQNALNQTYSQNPSSMAGVVTEPTGVRAGNGSIFSSHGQAEAAIPLPPDPAPTHVPTASLVPADTPPAAGVNAMTRSVFSTGTPVACGNDANGKMISC